MVGAPEEIERLVADFEEHLDVYKNPSYKESQLRQEFIDPFFKALGWNMRKIGLSPHLREVIHEDSIKIGGGTKAPDYCFVVNGQRMFFVEAKKPSVDIKYDIHPAYQLRRYAWSGNLPVSILTDFEEFSIYVPRTRPKKEDKPIKDREKYYPFTDYVNKWDEISAVFSKEAVKNGSLDGFREATKKRRGVQEVDDEFLHEIESWRESVAKNIAIRNPGLSVNDLNYSVQKTIDRIIFLRMAEDRGIERYAQLRSIGEKENIYSELCKLYKKADDKYNSGLFHFREEKGRATIPDEMTLDINVDDKVLKPILKNLYYPDSPYEFSVLPPEILGNVYERLLGKVIRLTPSHRAKIEEKPEVRKAGGVYYTPKYIVDYIVENTVGKLCKGKTPNQISELKILDPACGSGSFLLGAYSYLLKYHLDYYTKLKDPKRQKNQIYQGKDDEWFLTVKEKKRILLNNIYGVDKDPQAVEVTKLSLLLKVLEGESKDIFEQQQKLFQERALPDLGNNVRCGNSLIGSDYYTNVQTKLFEDTDDYSHINAFDWEKEFKEIMGDGGFDAVIGNPPYVKLHNLDKKELKYFFDNYKTAEKKCDIYAFFTERVLKTLLKKKGILGYIISNTWLNLDSFTNLREIVTKNNKLLKIVTLDNPFYKVTVTPIIFFVQKNRVKNYNFLVSHYDISSNKVIDEKKIPSESIVPPSNIIDLTFTEGSSKLVNKINQQSKHLVKVARLQYGIMTANNKKFVVSEPNTDLHKPLLSGEDIRRYFIDWPGDRYVDYRPNEMKKKNTARPGEPERFEKDEKIVFQRYSSTTLIASLDVSQFYTLGTTIIGHSISDYSNKYLLGIINSKLLSWWYGRTFTSPTNYIREFEALPIYKIDFSDSIDKAQYNKITMLVEQMLELNKKIATIKSPNEKQIVQRQIDAIDHQIDNSVYQLYSLTEDEIKIVEKIS